MIYGSVESPEQRRDHHHGDMECHCCLGFYCKVCTSVIPPKYRPVPDPNRKEDPLEESEVRKYWDNYYEMLRNRPVCKECDINWG